MLNMFIHFVIILFFFHFKVLAMANYTSHAAVDPNFEKSTSIKPKKNMQIFKNSRKNFIHGRFAQFFLHTTVVQQLKMNQQILVLSFFTYFVVSCPKYPFKVRKKLLFCFFSFFWALITRISGRKL